MRSRDVRRRRTEDGINWSAGRVPWVDGGFEVGFEEELAVGVSELVELGRAWVVRLEAESAQEGKAHLPRLVDRHGGVLGGEDLREYGLKD